MITKKHQKLSKDRPILSKTTLLDFDLDTSSYNKKLKLALFYLKEVGFNVIPAKEKDKVPIIPWKKYQKERVTEKDLIKWFTSENLNLACVLGRVSGYVVIDIDSQIVPNWLKDVKTWIAKSGKGFHYYFKISNDMYVPSERIDDKIELKGEGNIIILPGSTHPSGKLYRWKCFIDELKEPASFSSILPRIIQLKQKHISYNHSSSLSNETFSDKPSLCEKAYEVKNIPESENNYTFEELFEKLKSAELRRLYQGVPEGARNISMVRIAGSLFADGLNEDEVYSLLSAVNQRNQPPLTDKEIRNIVKYLKKKSLESLKIKKVLCKSLLSILESNNDFRKVVEETWNYVKSRARNENELFAMIRKLEKDILLYLFNVINHLKKEV
ncbi:MAG: bifunctional DNA primase/polymerase [Candidatus Aenigmatarchaeota archaeon]